MRAEQFVASYIDAWNHHDPEAVADHLVDKGVYVDVPEHTERTRPELIQTLRSWFEQFPIRHEIIGDVMTGRDSVAYQYRALFPERLREQYGIESFCGVDIISLKGDGAVTITDYYDMPAAVSGNKYAKSGLRDEQMIRYKRRLENTMKVDELYLDPNLTLPMLAEIIGCSVNHLSQVINAGFGVSFFDYLNRHRVQHAQKLLGQSGEHNQAILNIAFSVGFNSNSAFYAAFKKHSGMTPAQYRRSRL